MSGNQQDYEEEFYEGDYMGEHMPHDTIGEMEYQARKQLDENNAAKVAKAVLVPRAIHMRKPA